MDVFLSILSGNDHYSEVTDAKEAIAERAKILIPNFKPRTVPNACEGYCYDGNRCKPENLGWRLIQGYGEPHPDAVKDGAWDLQIEETYHEAAGAEHWYRHEKDWG